jgi:hypothetical protein
MTHRSERRGDSGASEYRERGNPFDALVCRVDGWRRFARLLSIVGRFRMRAKLSDKVTGLFHSGFRKIQMNVGQNQ